MVSTRHHPKEFPEPDLPPSLSPTKRSSSPSNRSSSGSTNGPAASAPKSPSKRSSTSTALTKTSSSSKISFWKPTPFKSGLHTPPPLLVIWLLVSLPLVIWDTGYVLLRPHSMEGGKFHSPVWKPYALYATVDYNYGWPAIDEGSGFTAAQGCLNAIETVGYLWYFWQVLKGLEGGMGLGGKFLALVKGEHRGARNCEVAVVVGFAVSIMTVSKTVLYWLCEYFSTPQFKNIGHNDLWTLFWIFIVPNIAWIIVPAYMSWVLGGELVWGMRGHKKLS